jgi:LmbE family N-acetylglucosaminyl deacetylase
MSEHRLLIAYAHPDDESFGLGGLIARYVKQGVDVYLICATNGDVGTVAPEMLDGYNSVAERRLAELDCANEILRFKAIFKFGYKDSGMMNSETSKDANCLWSAPAEDVTRRVVEVMRQIKPQVVITFNKYGGYGHPDHIAIQRATTDAFHLAGDPTYLTDGLSPYQPQKLYYSNIPALPLKVMIQWMRLRGQDPRHIGVNKDIDLQAVLDNVEPIHTLVDIRDYFAEWDAASACHVSQGGRGTISRIPLWLRKRIAPTQGFTRVHPAPARNRVDERDLFAHVQPQPLPEPVR